MNYHESGNQYGAKEWQNPINGMFFSCETEKQAIMFIEMVLKNEDSIKEISKLTSEFFTAKENREGYIWKAGSENHPAVKRLEERYLEQYKKFTIPEIKQIAEKKLREAGIL